MDRLNQLRNEAGGSRDSTLDTSSPPSEAYLTANDSSKYFSLLEDETNFSIKDVEDSEAESAVADNSSIISNLSPIPKKSDLDSYKIGEQIEAANILSGGVDIFDDNDNSYDESELVIDDNVPEVEDQSNFEEDSEHNIIPSVTEEDNSIPSVADSTPVPSKDTEVQLQIDGNNVDAIDIGNGLYLYRRAGEEDLAAVQILDNTKQQSNFKFLKVRENAEGNLEVYEEIEVEVPARDGPSSETMSAVPNNEMNRVDNEPVIAGPSTEPKEAITSEVSIDLNKESHSEPKMEVNLNGKTMKFSESRKSPVVGSYTPMTYHSTPNKEGIPLTKTMVDQQLHPSRHSDNIKKTIEVHTDHTKQRTPERPVKSDKDLTDVTSISKLDAVEVENNRTEEKHSEESERTETVEAVNSQDTFINVDLCESKPVEDNFEKHVEISKSDIVIEEDVNSETKTINMITDQHSSQNQESDTIINILPGLTENVNTSNNDGSEKIVSEETEVADSDVIIIENNSEVIENAANQSTDLKTALPDSNTVLDLNSSNIPVESKPKIMEDVVEPISKNVSSVNKNETKLNELNVDKNISIDNDKDLQEINENKLKESNVNKNLSNESLLDLHKIDETKLSESHVNKNISIENVSDVEVIGEIKSGKLNADRNISTENVPGLTQLSEPSELHVNDKVSIGNIPNVNKMNETKLEELNEGKNVTIGNVPDGNKINETELARSNVDKIVGIENVSNVKALSKVKDLNDCKNVNIGNVLDENKMCETKLAQVHVEKNVTIILDANKTSDIGNIQNVGETSESKSKERNPHKSVVGENVDTKISQGKKKEFGEHKNVSAVNVPGVSEGDKMKPKECLKDSDNIAELTYSETVEHWNLEAKETTSVSKNASNKSNLDQVDIKCSTDRKIFQPRSIPVPIKLSTDVSSTIKDCKDVSSNNVNTKLSSSEKLATGNLITKPVEFKNVISGNEGLSDKKPSTDNSVLTVIDKQGIEKDIQPISKNIEKSTDAKVTKNEQHSIKEKPVSSQITNKNTLSLKSDAKKEIPNRSQGDAKLAISNNAAVPFGKWTEANRQAFLNKIKETKVPTTNSNTKQIKQANDLNRRDILQKIDSQRQQQSNNALAKAQEKQKLNNKNETTAFVKSTVKHDSKIPVKERPIAKSKATINKRISKDEPPVSLSAEPNVVPNSNVLKKESAQRREINNQALIDKTIEEIINRVPPGKNSNEEPKQNVPNTEGIEKQKGMTLFGPSYHAQNEQSVTLDDIEMKMNELHGIPFVERPAHELPQKFVIIDNKTPPQNNDNPTSKIPNLLPSNKNVQQETGTEVILTIDSDDEIIEHEPITGDINPTIKTPEVAQKALDLENSEVQKNDRSEEAKKDVIITEKDFDKFFRRNSVTYENRLTVNFDGKEAHNVIQTVVEKDVAPKKLTRNEVLLAESKAKSTYKQQMLQARQNNHQTKMPTTMKYQTEEESFSKNYQSKVQIAYQSALTAKRQKESPITIIEDKPVKVVFMDSNVDLHAQVNIHSDKLSPVKKQTPDLETITQSTNDSLDSDILENFETKSQDSGKTKSKHQRKQVLTPVETPEMELIEPSDLGIEMSPKKKRKIDDKFEKSPKNHVPKKSYLLGRTVADDKTHDDSNKTITQDKDKIPFKEIATHNSTFSGQLNSISAIDNLVKAAEMLENQADSNCSSIKTQDSDSQQSTPIKRGRGRPRKYPLPDGDPNTNKAPSPQKKPRLIDAKVKKREETDDDDTTDDEIIRENWTMGKINEDIVCPICGKLFRSENVVFKHVKHCTGPSPNRSESDKRRYREISQESETRSQTSKSDDMEIEESEPKTPKKRKSKERTPKATLNSDEVIVIEDTPLKEKPERQRESRKLTTKSQFIPKSNTNLVCEICGKTFRQASYLAHHKLSHKNEELKKQETETRAVKSVFSCETCKKEFRKLHHLVQHRIIHNPNSAPSRTLRKSSSEQGDTKAVKEQNGPKPTEDQSAGFRCEPCDKSFRKLHHLVEHRETHDGINRHKATEVESIKPNPTHQCDMCDKTFKKLTSLNEHKEQHLETCSEKSDDKSVKSSLSTKDIIHECSLCYMVFPNEHSLNKHTVICIRKKKQSAAKAKQAAENKELGKETVESENPKSELFDPDDTDDSLIIVEDSTIPEMKDKDDIKSDVSKPVVPQNQDPINKDKPENIGREPKKEDAILPIKIESKPSESKEKEHVKKSTASTSNKVLNDTRIPTKLKRADSVTSKPQSTPAAKKKTPVKEKIAVTVTKRHKTVNVPLPVVDDVKPATESSDDDEVRYMLNPDFKHEEETTECKNFMKVKATKRNSLQIERPSSRDLVKRRISLQHPPKISRLKAKSEEQKPNLPSTSVSKTTVKSSSKAEKLETEPPMSTDSDDSDVKYSFPVANDTTVTLEKEEKKPQTRKSLTIKRKSLGGIAKRKSVGKAINSKHKVNTPPVKPVRKRTTEAEHRCDCGQLFSSAALLSRHTTLDHTPPRIRRRRSPEPIAKPKSDRSKASQSTEPKVTRKSNEKPSAGTKGRRATLKAPVPEKVRKLDKTRP